ncbi:MAG TPA: amino acid ABC transporter ATP-binding protein [Nocardioidaceae bacterium]|jgi:polar amino acid transport system ATP-binding protein|nr:amino acid ABC transporter ATP-binding protein [Nocardioidaceae bacterium]
MSLLRAENLWKQYAGRPVLRGIDLEVAAHQVLCVIGTSGSGKSTLLRCLNLLEPVDDGAIWLDGQEITDPRVEVDRVRRRIGIVFQAYNLFPHLSVLDNITLAPRKVHGVGRAEATRRARELLDRFGLAGKADDYPDRLSGGQQQRAAIVRALATNPALMLFDEVTSALDPELVGEVLGIIAELKDAGMTMVIATHEMSFAREIADTVGFLDGGVLLEQGPPQRIFAAPEQQRTREFLARVLPARPL